MSYELLVLPKKWLFSKDRPDKFNILSQIINKAYSKPMAKYGIIQTTRIKNYDKLLEELQITEKKECFISILLGSEEKFAQIERETGYVRNFDLEVFPLSTASSSDIPKQYRHYFEPLLPELEVKITFADEYTEINQKLANRLLAVCGYKTFYETDAWADDHVSDNEQVREYELTSFASFLGGVGPQLLDYTIHNFITNPQLTLTNQREIEKCVVHAVVIKEHELVPYYTKYCQFETSNKPDCLLPKGGENSPLEDGIRASQDFHLAFLRREVPMRVSS